MSHVATVYQISINETNHDNENENNNNENEKNKNKKDSANSKWRGGGLCTNAFLYAMDKFRSTTLEENDNDNNNDMSWMDLLNLMHHGASWVATK